jgi:methionine-S-sulfoxide reductase
MFRSYSIAVLIALTFVLQNCDEPSVSQTADQQQVEISKVDSEPVNPVREDGLKTATFAGGCFWCIEYALEHMDGLQSVKSGYTGGDVINPTYRQIGTGTTGHVEAVEVVYDPNVVSYEKLLDVFWRQIDPTDAGGQFADRGSQYETVIFYHDEEQKKLAEETKKKLGDSGKFNKPIVTRIEPAKEFYVAEEYHQDYSEKNPEHYQNYSYGSGRKPFIEKMWKDEK